VPFPVDYCKKNIFTYENVKMRCVETIPGMGGWGDKGELWGVNSAMIYCKNFRKCHNVPLVPQQNNKKEIKKRKELFTKILNLSYLVLLQNVNNFSMLFYSFSHTLKSYISL
jgi:hypothetical protein